jgi:class 3 adenylate cyclase
VTAPARGRSGTCPTCGAEVTPDLRFCLECGTSLVPAACPSCGTPRVSGARFCGQCGTRFADAGEPDGDAPTSTRAAGSARLGTERRLVSVLFVDLVGFTARSEAEDPEAVREFLSSYFDRTSEIIGRYGGTVEKFIGDAVMAVWGTPTAHEDDAERAVRAALDIIPGVAGLATDASVRAAVTTGEAAVDRGASGQALLAGDLVNTSSRLQATAPTGTVLVDETTMLAAGRAIAFEAFDEVVLKGKAEPVRTWTALRVVAERGGIGRSEGLEPPFVGRHEELRLLKDSLHATAREGKSRLVTIIGHAGYGKSRLAWELKKYTDGLAETIYWHEGETPAYGEGVAYWALGGMVRWRSHIGDGDPAGVARDKLRETVAEFVTDRDERTWIEPRLAALLGLADAPSGDREELFAAWRTFFERIAGQGTVALIFEDLHWADESLFDFIDHLLEWSRDHAILVVGLARPELLAKRPGWGSTHRSATTVHLDPLSEEALGDLLRGLVPGLPEPTLGEIVARAEGVPLYAVETIRMLLDGGQLVREGERYRLLDPDASIAVPASLQALIAARLDALDAVERSLVQDAAVLGKSFSRQALAAVSGISESQLGALLEQLVRKEIVVLDRSSHAAGERNQYEFVQSLLREVAYATLSRRDRRERHVKAADHFASLGDDELAGVVATHLLDAYRASPDGPEGQAAADRARVALRVAAERSVALHANHAAVAFIEQALTVTEDPAERARLWVMATAPAQAVLKVEESERYIRQAVEWYLANGDDDEADEAVAIQASWAIHSQRAPEIRELLQSRIARIDDRRAGPTAPRLLNELGRWHLIASEPHAAIEPLDRGLRIAERLMLEPELAELFATKSWAVGLQGRPGRTCGPRQLGGGAGRQRGFGRAPAGRVASAAGAAVAGPPRHRGLRPPEPRVDGRHRGGLSGRAVARGLGPQADRGGCDPGRDGAGGLRGLAWVRERRPRGRRPTGTGIGGRWLHALRRDDVRVWHGGARAHLARVARATGGVPGVVRGASLEQLLQEPRHPPGHGCDGSARWGLPGCRGGLSCRGRAVAAAGHASTRRHHEDGDASPVRRSAG